MRKKLVPFLKNAKVDPKNNARMVYDHLVINGKRFYYDPVSNGIKEKSWCVGRPRKRKISTKTVKVTVTPVSRCTTDSAEMHKSELNTADKHNSVNLLYFQNIHYFVALLSNFPRRGEDRVVLWYWLESSFCHWYVNWFVNMTLCCYLLLTSSPLHQERLQDERDRMCGTHAPGAEPATTAGT